MQLNLSKDAAKSMSRKIKDFVQAQNGICSTAQAYEFLAHLLNQPDWNTLNALLVEDVPKYREIFWKKSLILQCGADDKFAECPDYVKFELSSEVFKQLLAPSATLIDVTNDVSLAWKTSGLPRGQELEHARLVCDKSAANPDGEWYLAMRVLDSSKVVYMTTPLFSVKELRSALEQGTPADNAQILVWEDFHVFAIKDAQEFMESIACFVCKDENQFERWWSK